MTPGRVRAWVAAVGRDCRKLDPMRVLVVEDNADIAANVGDFLAARGAETIFATMAWAAYTWP